MRPTVFSGCVRRGLVLVLLGAVMSCSSQSPAPASDKSSDPPQGQAPDPPPAAFAPPDEASLGHDAFADEVRLGRELFTHTAERLPQYVGNHLACSNCHLDAGRQANSAPLWGAYGLYPAYRKKNGHVNTYAERLQECFRYSMNGAMPPAGDPAIVALETYSYWLATGAPLGQKLPGAGFHKLAAPARAPDYAHGEVVYQARCAACHGVDGAGRAGVFPAVWGAQSYNWGAGMHQVDNAAAFIEASMPLGQGGSLSVQDAWDVAFFVDAHERPQDPRYTGSVAATRQQFHDSPMSLYGTEINGHLLGSAAFPAGTVAAAPPAAGSARGNPGALR